MRARRGQVKRAMRGAAATKKFCLQQSQILTSLIFGNGGHEEKFGYGVEWINEGIDGWEWECCYPLVTGIYSLGGRGTIFVVKWSLTTR